MISSIALALALALLGPDDPTTVGPAPAADSPPTPGATKTPAPAAKQASKPPAAKKVAAPRAAPAPAPPPPAPALASPPTGDREIRTIPLTEAQARRVLVVRVSPSYPATIEFPEPFAAPPTCGDCGDKAGLFRLDVFNDAHYLVIKPRLFAGPQSDGSVIPAADFLTTITVRLSSFTLTMQIEYVDDPKKADPRIVFTLPARSQESAFVQQEIAKARKQLEEDFAAKLDKSTTQALLKALSNHHTCTPLSQHIRRDDIVVQAKELCSFGSRFYVPFTIENRARTTVEIESVTLQHGQDKKTLMLPDTLQLYLSTDHLDFQAVAHGVIGFSLDEGQATPRLYALYVLERGGLGRSLTLDGIQP